MVGAGAGGGDSGGGGFAGGDTDFGSVNADGGGTDQTGGSGGTYTLGTTYRVDGQRGDTSGSPARGGVSGYGVLTGEEQSGAANADGERGRGGNGPSASGQFGGGGGQLERRFFHPITGDVSVTIGTGGNGEAAGDGGDGFVLLKI